MAAILKIRGITKTYPGVRALQDVSFDVEEGTIHAIMGENGAGKSTLMQTITEPTSSLSEADAKILFRVIADLKARGVTMLYISHRFPEVFANCDAVTVLRDGKHVRTKTMNTTSEAEVVSLMVGRELLAFHRKGFKPSDEILFEVRGLTKQHQYYDINFKIHRGEIVALAGLIGAGRSEVALGVFGCPPPDKGEVLVQDQPVRIRRARDAMDAGIALAPEDRKSTGLVLGASVGTTVSMAVLPKLARAQFVDQRAEQKLVQRFVSRLNIRTPSHDQRVGLLSGGNQQKVMIAKWLAVQPKCLIVDEPTRGVDVGTKAEIYALFDELAHAGIPILMISSDLPEVLALADRILVMRHGRITGELTRAEATEEKIMHLAALGSDNVPGEEGGHG